MKSALITGVTGQDGSYLAELLLDKGYNVFGLARKDSWHNPNCASHLANKINVIYGDIGEETAIENAVQKAKPDEIYNLASQSRPGESWSRVPETLLVNGLAAARLFETVRLNCPNCRVYQASSSEMFGKNKQGSQNEETLFNPVNPYAAAKVYAHHMALIYRESYGLYIATGTLFNHESERRPLHFLTQKVVYGAACAALNIKNSPDLNERGRPIVENGKLALGNLNVSRDWGYAPDFVRAMWLILQQDTPDDFVIGTGKLNTLRDLCASAYASVNCNWKENIISDPQLVRPLEPSIALADYNKAYERLNWKPSVSFNEMIKLMVRAQIERLQKL